MISSTILNEVIDMHVRASEIKDLSRDDWILYQAKEYLKIMILTLNIRMRIWNSLQNILWIS